MVVLLDLEWIEKEKRYLTQLSACRIDENWNAVSSLDVFVRPSEACLREGDHMAFGGRGVELYRNGVSEEDCCLTLAEWLEGDDVVWVWARSNQQMLVDLWHMFLEKENPPRLYSLAKVTRKLLLRSAVNAESPYTMLSMLGIAPPWPEHLAANDVEAMRLLFARLGMTMAQLPAVPPRSPTPRPTQRERNKRTIEKSGFRYVYLKNSAVFHRPECRFCLNAGAVGSILGSVYYGTAAKNRRPCKVCKPVPPPPDAPIPVEDTQRRKTGARERYEHEIVTVKMLGGEVIDIKRGKIVGWCHHSLHKGAMNKAILTQHDCLGKNCPYLQRNPESPFWAARERERESKEKRKAEIKAEKQRRAEEAENLRGLTERWQSYLDELGSDMLLVRVEKEAPARYKLFYVSDNPFADGNRYPAFLGRLKAEHPGFRIVLRHIRDVDGHFVTREEYLRRWRK